MGVKNIAVPAPKKTKNGKATTVLKKGSKTAGSWNLHRVGGVGRRVLIRPFRRGTSLGRGGGRWNDAHGNRSNTRVSLILGALVGASPGVEVAKKEGDCTLDKPKFGPVVGTEPQGVFSIDLLLEKENHLFRVLFLSNQQGGQQRGERHVAHGSNVLVGKKEKFSSILNKGRKEKKKKKKKMTIKLN